MDRLENQWEVAVSHANGFNDSSRFVCRSATVDSHTDITGIQYKMAWIPSFMGSNLSILQLLLRQKTKPLREECTVC